MKDKIAYDKKIILLIIRKSYAELDWALPVLQELKKNFKIYTYFNSKEAFENIRSSKFFFSQWKNFSDKHYTRKKREAFILRLLFVFAIEVQQKRNLNTETTNFQMHFHYDFMKFWLF